MHPVNPTWRRHDRHRFIRHDAHRFFTPLGNARRRAAEAARIAQEAEAVEQKAFERELATLRTTQDRLRVMLAEVKYQLCPHHLSHKYGYNPDQPRIPAGATDGGQWMAGDSSTGTPQVRLAAMSWQERRRSIFGQGDLFGGRGVGGGGLANSPSLPPFKQGGPTAGVLQSPGKADVQFVSGTGGPASLVPNGTPGFDRLTRTHVEGQAAAYMRSVGVNEGILYINNPAICANCSSLLPSMLPSGARLNVVLPDGSITPFIGAMR